MRNGYDTICHLEHVEMVARGAQQDDGKTSSLKRREVLCASSSHVSSTPDARAKAILMVVVDGWMVGSVGRFVCHNTMDYGWSRKNADCIGILPITGYQFSPVTRLL